MTVQKNAKLGLFFLAITGCLLLACAIYVSFDVGAYFARSSRKAPEIVCQQAENLTPPPALTGGRSIVFIGDSITEVGALPRGFIWLVKRYCETLYPQQRLEFVHNGIPGGRSRAIADAFDPQACGRAPALIVVESGVNDVRERVDLAAFKADAEQLIWKAAKVCPKTLVLSIPLTEEWDEYAPERLAEYNRILQDLAKKHGCEYIDVTTPLNSMVKSYRTSTGARDRLTTVDGVHLSRVGNCVLANVLLGALGVSSDLRARIKVIEHPRDF